MSKPAAKPQDRKTKPTSKTVGQNFVYTAPGGRITLPLLDYINFGTARRLRKMADAHVLFELAEEYCDQRELAILDAMTKADAMTMFEAYYKASGVDLGESQASAS